MLAELFNALSIEAKDSFLVNPEGGGTIGKEEADAILLIGGFAGKSCDGMVPLRGVEGAGGTLTLAGATLTALARDGLFFLTSNGKSFQPSLAF